MIATTYTYTTKLGDAKTPLTVSESNLPAETLAQLPPKPDQQAVEERITANGQLEAVYAEEKPEPARRFKPAPQGFEPSLRDAGVWAAAERAGSHISVRGMPIKRNGLFFKNRADVWARRDVWPLVIWPDEDMTLVIWRNGRMFLCALNAAVEVDLPKSTLNKLYAIHFGGTHGA